MLSSVLLDYSVDARKSHPYRVSPHVEGLGVYIPTLASGTIGIEVYVGDEVPTFSASSLPPDVDTGWVTANITLVSGATTGNVFVPVTGHESLTDCWIRFACGADQTANKTFKIAERRR